VATARFPYFADFCKQILATGKVCAFAPLPGGLRCNPRRPYALNSLYTPCPARLRRAKDLCHLADVARQHHPGGKIPAAAEASGRAALPQGPAIRAPNPTARPTGRRARAQRARCSARAVVLFPELKLGIIVFTNQQSGAAFNAISNTIKDSYLGVTGIDRVKQQKDRVDVNEAAAKKATDKVWTDIDAAQKSNAPKADINDFVGTYTDKWFGDIVISVKSGKPWFDSKRSPKLSGEIFSYKGNTFIVKWNDRSMDADAYLQFDLDTSGKASGLKMNAISPSTDFSFDFQDLDFKRK